MSKVIQFQDSKRTTLDPNIISGYRVLCDKPSVFKDRIFSLEIILGKIQIKTIRLEYVIPDENIRTEFEKFIEEIIKENKENPDKRSIRCAKWTKEDYEKTKDVFLDDIQQLEMLILHS